jgi:hypothetical protein
MKAWILTAFYLWKDIWSRWLETPGAVLARLAVGALLAGLMLLAQAALLLAERSLEIRVARLGAQVLAVTESVTGDPHARPALGQLLGPAAAHADLIALRQVAVPAEDEFGRDLLVLVYGDESLPALAPLLAAAPAAAVHVINPRLPVGLPLRVTLDGRDYASAVLPAPAWLQRHGANQPLVLVPATIGADWFGTGWFETALLINRTGDLPALAAAVRAILQWENRTHAQVQSPEALLNELADLRRLQYRAQTGAGLLGGLVVALVFGSIAVLEYRQNRFVAALLRSFGAPAPLIIIRYSVEALLLTTAAVLLALWPLVSLHGWLFGWAGFESALLQRTTFDPYTATLVWHQARWLVLGALLSLIPVAVGLSQPVGRVLQ